MAFDCVADGAAEPAGGEQLPTAAVLPEGDHWAEMYQECSGDWTAGPAPNGTQQADQAKHDRDGSSPDTCMVQCFPNCVPQKFLFAKGSMAKKRACGQVSLWNAGSTGTFLQAFNKLICPVDLPEGDVWYSAFQTYLTLDPLF